MQPLTNWPPNYEQEPADLAQIVAHGWTCYCDECEPARDRVYLHFGLPRRPRHVGLGPRVQLPPAADLAGLQAQMRELAPHGWATDVETIERALAGLRERLATDG